MIAAADTGGGPHATSLSGHHLIPVEEDAAPFPMIGSASRIACLETNGNARFHSDVTLVACVKSPLPLLAPTVFVEDTRNCINAEDRKDGCCSRTTRFDPCCIDGCWKMHRRQCTLRLTMRVTFCRIMTIDFCGRTSNSGSSWLSSVRTLILFRLGSKSNNERVLKSTDLGFLSCFQNGIRQSSSEQSAGQRCFPKGFYSWRDSIHEIATLCILYSEEFLFSLFQVLPRIVEFSIR